MRKFDISQYETVKERKKRFKKEFPDGRIIPTLMNSDTLEQAVFRVCIYKNAEDQKLNLPLSIGYAQEIRDKEVKISNYGKEYESVNYTSWLENCEESAIGRSLDNAGYAGNDKCSREEMGKVVKASKKVNESSTADIL